MTGRPAPDIRAARESDAASLAQLAESTFREAFSQANAQQNMDAHCTNSFGVARQLEEIRNREMLTLLAEIDSRLIAFGQLRKGVTPRCVQGPLPMEIYRLYVDSPWHGKGVAHQLMSALIDQALEAGAKSLWLGVWEHNPRAIAFYGKFGFRCVGEHTFVLGTDKQRDLIMQFEVAGAPPDNRWKVP
jgi:ribosomal protein S18 acetylase RimI-like enzyme